MTAEDIFPTIASLSADVLNIKAADVTMDSNFFKLGGSSAQALQLCARIEQAFPSLFDEDGIDLAQIAIQPDMDHFVQSLLSARPTPALAEGEL